jgi:hypothetical protein
LPFRGQPYIVLRERSGSAVKPCEQFSLLSNACLMRDEHSPPPRDCFGCRVRLWPRCDSPGASCCLICSRAARVQVPVAVVGLPSARRNFLILARRALSFFKTRHNNWAESGVSRLWAWTWDEIRLLRESLSEIGLSNPSFHFQDPSGILRKGPPRLTHVARWLPNRWRLYSFPL